MMRLSWVVAVVLGAVPAGSAMAQGLIAPSRTYGGEAYQSPREYRPPSPSSLDKNYGLPTVGREGAEPPKPRAPEPRADASQPKADAPAAMQEEKAAGPSVPDFFAGAPEIALPKRRAKTDAAFGTTDTPLYTTSDGSALDTTDAGSTRGDMDTTSGDTLARTGAAAGR